MYFKHTFAYILGVLYTVQCFYLSGRVFPSHFVIIMSPNPLFILFYF